MNQRKRILQQSGIFLKQNLGEAHLTIDELREMAASKNANVFMSVIVCQDMMAILQAQMLTGME